MSRDLRVSDRFPPSTTEANLAKPTGITGIFRITHMDEFDQDFVDAEVPDLNLCVPDKKLYRGIAPAMGPKNVEKDKGE